MKLVFLGPPGAGKGTVAQKITQRHGIPHISTGDIFRKAIAEETELGKKVKSILDGGQLVPDELTIELVRERLSQDDTKNGFVLDGFPRTIPQAEGLDDFADLSGVINFVIEEELVVRRLSGRRIAKKSGRIYHVDFNPPKVENICDESGEELIIRPDDQEDAVRKRLSVYREQTEPLIGFYDDKGLLYSIDASKSPDEVVEETEELLMSLRR
jgi:adenylate kinase